MHAYIHAGRTLREGALAGRGARVVLLRLLLLLFGQNVSAVRFRVSGFGFRVSGFGCQVSGFGLRVSGFRIRISGFGFRVSGFGFRVSGFGSRPVQPERAPALRRRFLTNPVPVVSVSADYGSEIRNRARFPSRFLKNPMLAGAIPAD